MLQNLYDKQMHGFMPDGSEEITSAESFVNSASYINENLVKYLWIAKQKNYTAFFIELPGGSTEELDKQQY